MNPRTQSPARRRTLRRSCPPFVSGLTALSLGIAGLLAAPPAGAADSEPTPAATSTALGTGAPEGAGDDLDPAVAPSETAEASPEPVETGQLLPEPEPAPEETAAQTAAPSAEATPEATPVPDPADKLEADVEVPVEDLSQEQLLELLAVLQGDHGAEMGHGLEQRTERVEELAEPEVQEELKDTLEQLDIERTAAVRPAAAVPAANRNKWRPDGIQGIDVSSHQPDVNWTTEWNYGARFAYVKSTEALSYKNPEFSEQYTGSYRVGMIRGAYHFAIPNVSSGNAQANYFVNNGGGWSADGRTLPPLLDIEYNPYPELGNTCYNMSPRQMVAWIKEFSDTIKARTGRVPAIYTTADWWNHCTGNSTAFKNHPLHVAHYTQGTPWLPAGWTSYDIWQYSSSGPFVGDSNVWRGSWTALKNFAGLYDYKLRNATPGDLTADGNADLLSRRTDGTMWLYPGNGKGGFGTPRKLGSGWQKYNALIGAGDLDGDKRPDLLARHTDGSLWFHAGTSGGTLAKGVKVASSGWYQFKSILVPGDLTGDGKRDVVVTLPDGSAWVFPGRGTGAFGSRTKIASNWSGYNQLAAPGDFTGDGKADLLGRRPDGSLWVFPGTGKSSLNGAFTASKQVAPEGWNQFTQILGLGDNNRDRKADVLVTLPDRGLGFFAGTQMKESRGLATKPVRAGDSVWKTYDLVIAAGDLNGDGDPDLLARKPSGSLWFAPGNGRGGYGARTMIGKSGWNQFNLLVGVNDYDGDGRNDILARGQKGSLWLYRGTGRVSAGERVFRAKIQIGRSGWNQFTSLLGAGDVNGDGRQDLVAVNGSGAVYLYAGTGTGRTGKKSQADSGWRSYSLLTAVGDYNGDRTGDVVARKQDGSLWLLAGYRKHSATKGWFAAERRLSSSGWDSFNRILGVGRFDGDSKNDLVVTKPTGSGWFYAGTQFQHSGLLSRRSAGRL
ncbi:GH25 family lysozyme [Arthrobacter sp. GCM10027362]|uniref:GH25 family lysozyme n=1 Tax=Arthrobacter sp. GCM10027362 TaxID=3273379 RepID=UPI003637030D